ARDFERSGYDVKRLIRALCNTKAYQLDSRTRAQKERTATVSEGPVAAAPQATRFSDNPDTSMHTNTLRLGSVTAALPRQTHPARPAKGKPAPPDSFARALDKPLSAEQLFRSLLVATGNQPDAEGQIAGRYEKEI